MLAILWLLGFPGEGDWLVCGKLGARQCGCAKLSVELVGDVVVNVDAVYFGLRRGVLVCKSWLFQFVHLVCL